MTLHQCQNKAKDIGFNSSVFEASFPAGKYTCAWVDAYFGFFSIDVPGRDGIVTVTEVGRDFPHLECENLRVAVK